MAKLETFIIYLFIPIAFLLFYYVGFITMTKLKIKAVDDDAKVHFLRVLYGFFTVAAFTAILFVLKWIVVSILQIFK